MFASLLTCPSHLKLLGAGFSNTIDHEHPPPLAPPTAVNLCLPFSHLNILILCIFFRGTSAVFTEDWASGAFIFTFVQLFFIWTLEVGLLGRSRAGSPGVIRRPQMNLGHVHEFLPPWWLVCFFLLHLTRVGLHSHCEHL